MHNKRNIMEHQQARERIEKKILAEVKGLSSRTLQQLPAIAKAKRSELSKVIDKIADTRAVLADLQAEQKMLRTVLAELRFTNHQRGEENHEAKLSDLEVKELRRLHKAGLGYLALSRRFYISKSQVRRICTHTHRRTVK